MQAQALLLVQLTLLMLCLSQLRLLLLPLPLHRLPAVRPVGWRGAANCFSPARLQCSRVA